MEIAPSWSDLLLLSLISGSRDSLEAYEGDVRANNRRRNEGRKERRRKELNQAQSHFRHSADHVILSASPTTKEIKQHQQPEEHEAVARIRVLSMS